MLKHPKDRQKEAGSRIFLTRDTSQQTVGNKFTNNKEDKTDFSDIKRWEYFKLKTHKTGGQECLRITKS